jgi:two-component system cell cycle sensor histidine kinase/response regulator CckA
MNHSDIIIIAITGLLQLAVAINGLRLTRRFGVARVGWSLFSAFALLALVHLFEAVSEFHRAREFETGIELVYAFISFMLLAGLAHLETVLTERQRLEQQARKLETIGQFAEGITHDFNNIVTAISANVDLLLLKEQDAETAEQLNQIHETVNRAGALTRQLLAFGRGHAAKIELLDLNALIENLVKMLRHLLGSRVTLTNTSDTPLPFIVGDASMIEEIVVNLAVNARDAMPKGGQLTIGATAVKIDPAHAARHRDARAGEFVCIRARDTGAGIPPEVLPRIFDAYFTTKEAGKGTGLGLATVQRITKQHSGWIEVESQPGVGTQFTIYFPCAPRSVIEAQKDRTLAPVAADVQAKAEAVGVAG